MTNLCPSYLSFHYKSHTKLRDSVVCKKCIIRILGHLYKVIFEKKSKKKKITE